MLFAALIKQPGPEVRQACLPMPSWHDGYAKSQTHSCTRKGARLTAEHETLQRSSYRRSARYAGAPIIWADQRAIAPPLCDRRLPESAPGLCGVGDECVNTMLTIKTSITGTLIERSARSPWGATSLVQGWLAVLVALGRCFEQLDLPCRDMGVNHV